MGGGDVDGLQRVRVELGLEALEIDLEGCVPDDLESALGRERHEPRFAYDLRGRRLRETPAGGEGGHRPLDIRRGGRDRAIEPGCVDEGPDRFKHCTVRVQVKERALPEDLDVRAGYSLGELDRGVVRFATHTTRAGALCQRRALVRRSERGPMRREELHRGGEGVVVVLGDDARAGERRRDEGLGADGVHSEGGAKLGRELALEVEVEVVEAVRLGGRAGREQREGERSEEEV